MDKKINLIILKMLLIFCIINFILVFCKPSISFFSSEKRDLKNVNKIITGDHNRTKKDAIYYVYNKKIVKLQNKKSITIADNLDSGVSGTMIFSKNNFEYALKIGDTCYINGNGNKSSSKRKCPILGEEGVLSNLLDRNTTNEEFIIDNDSTGINPELSFSSKKYFVGANPNNYLILNNACYRIIGVAQNDTVKIIYEGLLDSQKNCENISKDNSGSIALLAWNDDNKAKINWNDSSLNHYMQNWVSEGQIDMKNFIVKLNTNNFAEADWYIGEVSRGNDGIKENVLDEQKIITNKKNKIGLINVSDYQKVSNQKEIKLEDISGNNNYLYKSGYDYWTINSINDNKNEVWQIQLTGNIESQTIPFSKHFSFSGVRPVFYLKNNIQFIGTGTSWNPYTLSLN